jgi:hypothetical protein
MLASLADRLCQERIQTDTTRTSRAIIAWMTRVTKKDSVRLYLQSVHFAHLEGIQ